MPCPHATHFQKTFGNERCGKETHFPTTPICYYLSPITDNSTTATFPTIEACRPSGARRHLVLSQKCIRESSVHCCCINPFTIFPQVPQRQRDHDATAVRLRSQADACWKSWSVRAGLAIFGNWMSQVKKQLFCSKLDVERCKLHYFLRQTIFLIKNLEIKFFNFFSFNF